MQDAKIEIHLVNDSVIETTSHNYNYNDRGVTVTEILEGDKRRRTFYPWHRIADVVSRD